MEPRITATDDNRFVLAWRRYSRESAGSLNDIYYAVRHTNGNPVKGITKFTNGVAGDDYYYDPALTSLSGNRALLAYYANGSISYAVLNSAGNVFKGETATGGYGYGPDAVQLANGSVLLAWTSWGADLNEISFAVLDGTNYNVVAGPTALSNPAAVTGNDYVSVAADGAGRGILTWMDRDYDYRRNLYYALVDSSGAVLTDPMIFRTSQATDPNIETSFEGYGNTSWTGDFTPPTNPTSLSSSSHVTATWSNDNTVAVAWSGASDADSGVDGYSVLWDNTSATVPDATKDVEESVQTLTSDPLADGDWYFHIRAVDGAGNWATGAVHVGPFKIDATPPASAADAPEFTTEAPVVSWSGMDEGSGIASYDVQVREGADGVWTNWLEDTTVLSDTYTAVETGHTYYFRSVAYDQAGNVEIDLPADGDTHTTVAEYQAEGRVTNNRGQPVFNATVSSEPTALNTAATDTAGDYALYFDSGGAYTLTVERSGFGALPPMYDLSVDAYLTGVDLVLSPEDEAVTNGGWENGDLSGWNSSPGMTVTAQMTAAHTGRYGVNLEASGGTLAFWSYVTQTVPLAADWSQPTLSFLYRAVQGEEGDALQAVIVGTDEQLTHTVALSPAIGAWTHTWRDLSDFAGQTVTLRFGFQEQTAGQQVYLDEISVGESKAGVLSVYLPLVMRSY